MIRFKQGDIFGQRVEAIVNPVNCVGTMGKGLALQFRERFPDNFKEYARACREQYVQPGRMLVYKTWNQYPQYIINFPTKRHWRENSRIEDIESGITALAGEITRRRINSIAIPPLGAGLGGLNWQVVRKAIIQELEVLTDVEIIVLEPQVDRRPSRRNTRYRR